MIGIGRWLVVGTMLALTACATAPAQKIVLKAEDPAVANAGEADVQRVVEGVHMVGAGKIQAAIDGPFNDVVNRYESRYGHSKEKIFSARDTADALLYSAMAASAKPPVSSIVIGPAWAMAYWGRGYAYNEMARYDDAIVELGKALALAPSDTQYNIEIGYSYQRKAQWQTSLDHYKAAEDYADLTVPAPEVANLKCKALRGQGYDLVEMYRFDASRAAYRACLTLIPKEPISLGELKYVDQAEAKSKAAAK
jgi:tetratricopeptide (TPR) repeat protein